MNGRVAPGQDVAGEVVRRLAPGDLQRLQEKYLKMHGTLVVPKSTGIGKAFVRLGRNIARNPEPLLLAAAAAPFLPGLGAAFTGFSAAATPAGAVVGGSAAATSLTVPAFVGSNAARLASKFAGNAVTEVGKVSLLSTLKTVAGIAQPIAQTLSLLNPRSTGLQKASLITGALSGASPIPTAFPGGSMILPMSRLPGSIAKQLPPIAGGAAGGLVIDALTGMPKRKKRRRMNPLNAKAARRAIRRIKAVRKITRDIERSLPKQTVRRSVPAGHRSRLAHK